MLAHAALGYYLANAGQTDRAIEWLEASLKRDANPMPWHYGNLAMAYYLAGRTEDAIATFGKMEEPWQINLAAAYAQLGKLDNARASIENALKSKPGWTIRNEAIWSTTRQPQLTERLLKV